MQTENGRLFVQTWQRRSQDNMNTETEHCFQIKQLHNVNKKWDFLNKYRLPKLNCCLQIALSVFHRSSHLGFSVSSNG